VGIGGTAEHACLLAKKALLKKISHTAGKQASMEKELLKRINRLHIGPMGLGGSTTAVAVKVATAATHIAGLPVAVNISCHATRQASVLL
jgi:fumarate hydratase subunit alpha